MTDVPLRESGSVVVGATSRATVTLQPMRSFERWEITRTTVANTGTVLVPACRIYRGSEAAGSLIEGTYSGRQDSSDTKYTLENGEKLIVVWEGKTIGSVGADVGSVCTVVIEGRAVRDAF
jgi:hypothetical protein